MEKGVKHYRSIVVNGRADQNDSEKISQHGKDHGAHNQDELQTRVQMQDMSVETSQSDHRKQRSDAAANVGDLQSYIREMKKMSIAINRDPHSLQHMSSTSRIEHSQMIGDLLDQNIRRGNHQKEIGQREKQSLEILHPK